jgi:hypothetical protein
VVDRDGGVDRLIGVHPVHDVLAACSKFEPHKQLERASLVEILDLHPVSKGKKSK